MIEGAPIRNSTKPAISSYNNSSSTTVSEIAEEKNIARLIKRIQTGNLALYQCAIEIDTSVSRETIKRDYCLACWHKKQTITKEINKVIEKDSKYTDMVIGNSVSAIPINQLVANTKYGKFGNFMPSPTFVCRSIQIIIYWRCRQSWRLDEFLSSDSLSILPSR